jgi:predicted nucleic acid-binding protein
MSEGPLPGGWTKIHLDTNLIIDLVEIGSPHAALVRRWVQEGKRLCVSAVAWSEFLNGPHTKQQKDAVFHVIEGRILPFGEREAELASRLFHYTGRKRGSHADCMIAAVAIAAREYVATRNLKDFERFVPHGLMLLPVETVVVDT